MITELLKKNTIWIALSDSWLKGLSFLAFLLIARVFGDTIFGQISFVIAYLQLFQLVFDFGLHMILTREISQRKERTEEILSTFLGFKLVLGVIVLFLLGISMFFLHKPPEIIRYILLSSGFMIFMSTNTLLRNVFVAHEKFVYDAYSKILESSIFIVLVGIGLATESIILTVLSYSMAACIGFGIVLMLLKKNNIRVSIKISQASLLDIAKNAWPLALAGLFVIIYFRIDTIMLSYMQGDAVTGWYNAAYHFMYTFVFIPAFIMTSFFPKLSQFAKESTQHLRTLYTKSLGLIVLVAVLLMSFFYYFADTIILAFYGPAYTAAIPVLRILTIAVFLSYLSHVWLFTLTAIKKQHLYTWAVGFGMILNIILNAIFIPRYSLIAAAWTTVVTEITTAIFIGIATHYFVFSKRNDQNQ